MKWSENCSVVSDSLRPHGLYGPWNSPGQNTGMGSLSFLQGIFPTQRLNPGLLHCRQILYQLSHQGSPCISTEPYLYSFTYLFTCWSSISMNSTSADPTNLISKIFLGISESCKKENLNLCALATIYHLHCTRNYKKS